MRVHRGMPVEAAEKHGMHVPRRFQVRVAFEQVLRMIRVFARDVRERTAREIRYNILQGPPVLESPLAVAFCQPMSSGGGTQKPDGPTCTRPCFTAVMRGPFMSGSIP